VVLAFWPMSSVYARGVRFFHRHVVPIQFEFTPTNGGKPHFALISSFLVSVRGTWLLLTAGHCIDEVQENLDKGCSMRCWLVDCAGQGAKHKEMVPFDWGDAAPARLFPDPEIDLGIVWLRSNACDLLSANGLEPFTEEAWDYEPPPQVDAHLLMGMPAELARPASPVSSITPVALLVFASDERPAGLEETKAERWYGYADQMEGFSDIRGMSGGPILAVGRAPDGSQRYWLFAMQSAWHRPSRAIAAVRTRPALRVLGEMFEEIAARAAKAEPTSGTVGQGGFT
jgi:hypothetical protein